MMDLAQITQVIPEHVPTARLAHVYGVRDTAVAMAEQLGLDAEKAAIAALLHDVARFWSDAELLRAAARFGILVDIVEQQQPGLLHGPVAAEIAQQDFAVTDPDVLQAIRLHTTGDRDMSPLAQVIFLADLIEPGRDYPGVDDLRQQAATDFAAAVLAALRQTIEHVLRRGWLVHPRAIAAYNWLIQRR